MAGTLIASSLRMWESASDPGVSEPYVLKADFWLNSTSKDLFLCKTPTIGAQVWEKYPTYVAQQSFAPTIIGSTSAGVGTYTLQQGYYTKIGNMVFLALQITWTNHTGTGDLWIDNLPFTARNSSHYSPEGIVNTQNMTLPGGANSTAIGSIFANTNYLTTYVTVNGGANSPIQMQTSGNIHATIAYLT